MIENKLKPFLGVCVIFRDNIDTIDALLESIMRAPFRDGHKGPAFEEYVFVDTGSTDGTRERIEAQISILPKIRHWESVGPDDSQLVFHFDSEGAPGRIVLADFAWVDDFAAARNFSFELGTAKWRMYLDTDDVFPKATNLLPSIQKTERTGDDVNCIFMDYDYAPNETAQTKIRAVRWADGWRWQGEIHEALERFPEGESKRISQYKDLAVLHRPTEDHGPKSLARNIQICDRVYNQALAEQDTKKQGLMAYYLGIYARHAKEFDSARGYLLEVAELLGPTNLACYALVELTRLEMARENWPEALAVAGRAQATAPEYSDGWGAVGAVLSASGHHARACLVFDAMKTLPPNILQTNRDLVWNDGIIHVFAAQSYLAERRAQDAATIMAKIPENLALHELVWMGYSRAMSDYYKLVGLQRLEEYVSYLVWNNEPVKALEVLDEHVASNIEASPVVSHFKKAIWDKMQQMKSWPDYKRVYAAECNEVFDRDEDGVDVIRAMGRSQLSLEWAQRLPKEGPPFHLYVVGIHGGWIEEDVMDANPRIHLTACDVNPNANSAIQRLRAKFPGRVDFHTVVHDHYDWIPDGREGTFDAVFCFEVIEHVPSALKLLAVLNTLLKIDGELLLSTPIAEYWVAPDATKRHHWHQHVRAYQPHQLWEDLRFAGFTGDMSASDNRILFFAIVKKEDPLAKKLRPEIAIWIPSTPKGFDPQSALEGHVGGSEEAVIHLAPQLQALGAEVTVYVDKKPDRAITPHAVSGVLWRDGKEFDPARTRGTVLVWRHPQSAAWLKKTNSKLRVLNWLHDVSYKATPEQYAEADGTIVLSDFHAQAIAKYDGFKGPFLFAANGIDAHEFSTATIGNIRKDPHNAIYASAPNRGLDMLLDVWPLIRQEVPDATLDVYYGWEITEQMMRNNPQLNAELGPLLTELREGFAALADQGVTYHGGVDHATLHRAYAKAGVWAYPCHTFEEIFCISALKAQAAGAWPVTMDVGALAEVIDDGEVLPDANPIQFVAAVVDCMLNPITPGSFNIEAHSWERVAERFLEHAKQPKRKVTILAAGYRRFDSLSLYEPRGAQVGGSEEAVITLSEELAEQGVDVTVYADMPEPRRVHRTEAGVTWKNAEHFKPDLDHGAVIVWRSPKNAAELKRLNPGYPVISWLMDPSYSTPGEDYCAPDAVVGLTEAHREVIAHSDGYSGQMEIIHNGLVLSELPPLSLQNDKGRHMDWIMWATSPDRGLWWLLVNWTAVRASVPTAQLHIFYGLEGMEERAARDPVYAEEYKVAEIKSLIHAYRDQGVTYHGGASRTELLAWHVRCGVFAFPCEGFVETFCMSVVKAMACGIWPVVTDVGALPEVCNAVLAGSVVPASADYSAALIRVLQNPPSFAERKAMADDARELFNVSAAANKWIALLDRLTVQVAVDARVATAAKLLKLDRAEGEALFATMSQAERTEQGSES